MPIDQRASESFDQCKGWIARRDGKTSEITLLDIPEGAIDRLLAAIREQVRIVAVLGRDGPELFAELNWMDDQDEDLIWSTFFMAVLDDVRLQHSLGPSRPSKPGPWMAVTSGSYDLELAFWPDEIFVGDDEADRALYVKLLGYAQKLRALCGASGICVTHGCYDDPRRLIAGEFDRPFFVFD